MTASNNASGQLVVAQPALTQDTAAASQGGRRRSKLLHYLQQACLWRSAHRFLKTAVNTLESQVRRTSPNVHRTRSRPSLLPDLIPICQSMRTHQLAANPGQTPCSPVCLVLAPGGGQCRGAAHSAGAPADAAGWPAAGCAGAQRGRPAHLCRRAGQPPGACNGAARGAGLCEAEPALGACSAASTLLWSDKRASHSSLRCSPDLLSCQFPACFGITRAKTKPRICAPHRWLTPLMCAAVAHWRPCSLSTLKTSC